MIRTKVDKSANLTVEICTGKIDIAEISEKVVEFYKSAPTMNILWDFTEADVSGIEADEIKNLADFAAGRTHSREGGKTAIVSPGDVTFGLSRMFQSFTELTDHPAEVRIFRTVDEAKRWFES